MKNITDVIKENCTEHGNINIKNECKRGWMTYDENSGTVMSVSADKEQDLADKYGIDEDYFDDMWLLKVGETFQNTQDATITTRIW